MPIYTLPNGKKYNIPKEKESQFISEYPNAIIEQKVKLSPIVQGAIVGSDIAPVNMDLALGIPSSDSLGNLNNNLLDLSISYNNPKKEDISFSESVANSLSNMVERIKQISPKINLTSGMIYRKIFGDENVDKFVEYAGDDSFWTEGLSKKDKIEAINKIRESQAKSKETGEIIQGFKEGDISDIAGGIFNAATSFVPSLIEGGAGFLLGGKVGAGLMIGTDFFGDSYISINKEKAEKLNMSLENLVNSGNDEVLSPLIFSSAMSAAETIGLGKVAGAASKQLTGAAMKKLSNFILAGAAESGTEIIQTALEKAQQEYGKTDDIGKTAARFAEAFTEQDTWEAGIQGFLGGAGFSGLGNKNVRNAISLGRASEDIKGIENDIDELSDLNTRLRGVKDATAKTGIENKISEVQERLKNRIIKGNAIFDFASDKDINEINNLDDLAKLQVKRFNDLKEKKNKNKITQEEYSLAAEGYKAEYIKAKNRIQGIKENLQDKSNKQAQEVNKIYEEKGKEGIAEILELYRPMAKRIASKYRMVPGFEMKIMTDEILTGERGILDLINSYKPDTKVPLSAYINKFAATRGIEAAKRNLKDSFELDVTEAKGVTDTVEADTKIETKENAQQEVKKALAQDLNLSEDTQNEIVTAVEKTLGTKLPAVTDKGFKPALTKGFRTELTNTLKKVFGRTASYEQFLRDNFEKIYPAIPQETINKKFKEFNEAVVDPKTGKQLRERTAEGKKVFKKRDIAKAEFIKYFLDAPGNVKGARKTSLAEVIADEVGLDNVLGALARPEVVEKFKAIQELQGQEVPSNFIEIISEKIDRAIDYLDKLQNNNNQLYVSLGFPEISIAAAKAFLKAAKLVIKAGGNFANALKAGIEALQQYVQSERAKKEIAQKVPTIIKNVEDFANQEKAEQVTNIVDTIVTKDKAFAVLNNSINSLKETIKNSKDLSQKEKAIFEFLKYELAGLVKINVGGKKKVYLFKEDSVAVEYAWEWFSNQNVLDKETSKLFKLKNVRQGKSIVYRDQNINDFRGKHRPSSSAIKITKSWEETYKTLSSKVDAQNIMNDAYAEYAAKKIAIYVSNNEIDLLDKYLEISGLASDSAIRTAAKFGGIEKGKKGDKLVYEHTPPIKQTRNDIKNIVNTNNTYLQNYENVLNILKKTRVDFITEKTANKLNSTKKGKESGRFPKRFKNILDVENNLVSLRKEIPSENFKGSLNKQFNELLQKTTGTPFYETFSPVKAAMIGKGKGKKFFIPYSADDFVGLLYATLAKGKAGDQQMAWYEQNLLRPFSRGIQQYEAAKQNALRNWQALKKEAKKDVPGGLNKVNSTGFTNQNSVRVYIWQKQGEEINGVTGEEIKDNVSAVKNNPKLLAFAERLIALNPEGYPPPSPEWNAGDITTDLVSYINGVKRSEFLTQWKENANEIFNEENKNKLKALYGEGYIKALENMLYRMEKGRNKFKDASDIERKFQTWVNNSVGAIMFFNARSAVLQTLSAVNFINFSDNNPIAAGLALANFPQYVKDFSTLFNSDFLKQRRTGLQTDVNADEIAKAAATAKNKAQAMMSAVLKFGFTPTQMADSFAIASGGATFYRNRINKYKKEGLEQAEAKAKAFTDFQEIAEETQQSARPDRISMQQAGSLGRLILAFGNTPMQYARLTKKATLDLINGRGDWKTNVSKIAYYSVIQNIIFSALQQGLFALLFDDEEDEEKKSRFFRIGNSSADTLLRGAGVYGAAAATVKNMIIKIIEESEKSRPDYKKLAIEATSISPPINSKLRKLESAGKTFTYKQSKEKVFTEGFSLENPAFLAAGKIISAGTNLPADRVVQKMDHIYTAMQPETELWQGIALSLGWGEWELGMIEKQTKKSEGRKVIKRSNLRRKKINRKVN